MAKRLAMLHPMHKVHVRFLPLQLFFLRMPKKEGRKKKIIRSKKIFSSLFSLPCNIYATHIAAQPMQHKQHKMDEEKKFKRRRKRTHFLGMFS
jgi:hypothetical protein